MRVNCQVEEVELDGEYRPVEGLCVTCSRCGHEVEVFGTHERSLRRALVMLRDECPEGESNFYVAPDQEDEG